MPPLVALAVRFIQNNRLLAGKVAWFMLREAGGKSTDDPDPDAAQTLIPLVKEAAAVITKNGDDGAA